MSTGIAPLSTYDFWRVASYGYPNPFRSEAKAQAAWDALKTFYDYDGDSYKELKEFWDSPAAPRDLNSHAIESWKQAFEEFGLLYVITRSDRITITPGGWQCHRAVETKDEQEFNWVGLNLILRYPLAGPPAPRRPKSESHGRSDLLLYRFLYSAMRDLGDYFWFTELYRVFSRVFFTSEAQHAVEVVKDLRSHPHKHTSYALPTSKIEGAFYNSLNQVPNHAGLNHMLMLQDNDSELYGPNEPRRRHLLNRRHLSMILTALGDFSAATGCATSAMYVDRLPTAPRLATEQAYFDYLGAEVPKMSDVLAQVGPRTITVGGDTVFVLKEGEHYRFARTEGPVVEGSSAMLCRLARNHRVILSTDMAWTYLVEDKNITAANTVQLVLRRARPITNPEPINQLLEDNHA